MSSKNMSESDFKYLNGENSVMIWVKSQDKYVSSIIKFIAGFQKGIL